MYGLTINGGTHNVVFVATLNDSVYAIDADTNALLWQVNLGTPCPSTTEGCSGVTGFNQIGILATPVIDPNTNTMYLTAKTYGTGSGPAAYSLHALDVTTGAEKFGGPTTIAARHRLLNFHSSELHAAARAVAIEWQPYTWVSDPTAAISTPAAGSSPTALLPCSRRRHDHAAR